MAIFKSDHAKGLFPPPNAAEAGKVMVVRPTITIPGGTTLAVNDELWMCVLPAGHRPHNWELDIDDMDANGTPTLELSFGLGVAQSSDVLAGGGPAAGSLGEWKTAITTGRAGGVIAYAQETAFRRAAAVANYDRIVGFKVTTAAATGQAAATVARLHFAYYSPGYA